MNTNNMNNSRLNYSLSKTSSSSSKRNNSSKKLLYFEDYAYHVRTKGKLSFDINTSLLKFEVLDSIEKSDNFIKKYGEKEKITISKSDIKDIGVTNSNKDNIIKYYFRIILKNNDEYIFFFNKEQNKDYEKIRDKFVRYLKEDFLSIYISEFQKMDIRLQKKICFFMKNEDLFFLYKTLSKYNFDPEIIFRYIKYLHPEKININLGYNRIQLSRDEELIMSINLNKKKFNVNKLISSDIDISKIYFKEMEKKGFKNEEFWNDFYNQQKDNKTYLIGEYNPIINHENDDTEINNNNLMEELEKNKYYYDNYESNYLYNTNNDEYYNKLFKTINNYSMNKMKEINYFSFSPMSINIYNNRPINKNKFMNKKIFSSSSITLQEMEIEPENFNKDINKKRRIPKRELYDRINKMRKEHEEKKLQKNNMNNSTMKTIIEEIDKIYNLTNVMNFSNNNADDLKDIYLKVSSIKDLSYILKSEKSSSDKRKLLLQSNKKQKDDTDNKDKEKNSKCMSINNDIKEIYNSIKSQELNFGKKSPIKFLLRYAKYDSFI